MPEEISEEAADAAVEQENATENAGTTQDNTEEASGEKGAATLLDDKSSNAEQETKEETKDEKSEETKKEDLLGEVEQQEGEEKAPDKYEPFTLADGTEMSAEDAEAISKIAKEHNLSQESAQKAALVANDLVDSMVKEHEGVMEKVLEENAKAWKQQDPTGERTMLARKAVKHYGEDMHAHLKGKGYLNDARIMQILADCGESLSEGKSISGKPAQQQSLLYPNTPELHNS